MNTQLRRGTVSAYTSVVWPPCSLTPIRSLPIKLNDVAREDDSYVKMLVAAGTVISCSCRCST